MALDFGSLKPAKAEWVSPSQDNPTVPWLRESRETDTARQVSLPAKEAHGLVNLLNTGAKTADLGVSIRVVVGGEEYVPSKELWETVDKMGTKLVAVKFKAKRRTARPRKNTVTGETPAQDQAQDSAK